MCGFLGSITFKEISNVNFEKYNKRIECRGPDEKVVICNKNFVNPDIYHNYTFNRLSIIDLSKNASQPMQSDEFNSLIMFNGEIYNHRELRAFLEQKGVMFKSSHSDTEALLLGLSAMGMDFLKRLNGQFAIFFHDINKNEYYLIRDRVGQKPLYFAKNSEGFYFGSDLISVKSLSNNHKFNEDQIKNFINFGTSITPNSFFSNVFSVSPGEFIKISLMNNNFEINKYSYWDLPSFLDDKEFIEEEFIDIFENSVEKRLESDVPVSNFLSGGLDSSAVIKALNKKKKKINTFSMITKSKIFNESEYIDQVVKKYNTNHTYREISDELSFENIKTIISKYDDIIYDPSLLPTYILSKNISEDYKVALSGDGGDELLSGYAHYSNFHNKNKSPDKFIDLLFNFYPSIFGSGNNILKNSNDWKKAFSSYYEDKKLMNLLNINDFSDFRNKYLNEMDESWKSLMITDYNFFLNEMMLKKIDRSSMLCSLEIRSPFLDHRLAEYVVGHNYLVNDDNYSSKKIIKNYLSEDFDKSFIDREKMGFSIDIKNIVTTNQEEILDTILCSPIENFINLKNMKRLKLINSRMNALRLWKLYSISLFLENNKTKSTT